MAEESVRRIEYEKLRIEQYKSLNEQVLKIVEATTNMERFVLGAAAALYAYLASNRPPHKLVWYLPVTLVLFGGWRSLRLFTARELVYQNIRQIEKEADLPKSPVSLRNEARHKLAGLPWTAIILWVMLLVISLIAPVLLSN